MQKFLILMKFSLSVISFKDHALDVVSKKSSPYPGLSRFSPRRFIVLHFTFRSVIHYEFSFVKNIRSVTRFFFFFFCM